MVILTLPIVGPVMLFIAAMIKLVSPGPIFFRQERIGLNGESFVIFKFRTMTQNAATTTHQDHLKRLMSSKTPMTKLDSMVDTRVFRGGGLLRSLGLDELPQLINILRGEMSWVGPRPCMRYEYESYKPEHRGRFETLPGLTGLWQVSGKNRTTFDQMIGLDICYARAKTIWLDLVIMMRTPMVLMQQFKEVVARKRKGFSKGKITVASVSGAELPVMGQEQLTVN